MAPVAAETLEDSGINSSEVGEVEVAHLESHGLIGILTIGDLVGEDGGLALAQDIGYGDLDCLGGQGDPVESQCVSLPVGRLALDILLDDGVNALVIIASEDDLVIVIPIGHAVERAD